MPDLRTSQYEQIVSEQTARFAGNVSAAGPSTTVPTCPEWDVTELAQHVGQTQLFYANMINDQASSPAEFRWPEEPIPADPSAWTDWLASTSGRLLEAVRSAGPDGPVWNPTGESTGGVAFWLRREFGELAAHGFDASAAAGRPYELEPPLAADALSEFLEMVTSSTWAMNMPESAAGMRGSGQTMWWSATDVEPGTIAQPADWLITRTPEGPVLERRRPEHGSCDVAVVGPAAAILPLAIRRTSIDQALADGVRIDGDRTLLTHWSSLVKY